MLRDGKYAAWFRTSRGQGTGIVHLVDGTISGCDSFFTYGGSYRVDENGFTADLRIRRYADGPQSVFRLDEVEVSVAGMCNGWMATCSGTSKRAPDLPLEVTLIYDQDEASPPAKGAVVKLNPDRLAKNFDGRLDGRSRPPYPLGPSRGPAS